MAQASHQFTLAAGLIVNLASCAWATTIYDNGSTTFDYGSEVAGFQQADDFTVSTTSAVSGVRFWTTEGEGIRNGAVPFNGHIDYWIYSDVSAAPGSVLAQGIGVSIDRLDLGVHNHWYGRMHRYQYSFEFEHPFLTGSGQRYFLSLHMLDHYPFPNGEIYWATADGPTIGASSHRRDYGSGPWIDNSTGVGGVYGAGHLAFQLDGYVVPEPSTAFLALSYVILSIILGWPRILIRGGIAARSLEQRCTQSPSFLPSLSILRTEATRVTHYAAESNGAV